MKTIYKFFTIVLFFIAFNCNQSANSQAPEAVKKSFQEKYPGENDPDWHTDAHGNFESHFKIDGVKYRADFNADGSWIETETSIDKDDLPKAIKEKIKNNFDGDITEIEKVDHHLKGIFYDVEFKQKGKNKDIEFKSNGTIIN